MDMISGKSILSGTAPPQVIVSPCAACKILRRRCAEKCVLAPYFPPSDPIKFSIAHKVFGASNIIKLLQDLPESQRADAVSSMVYEANARVRDPVYGSAGAICTLQKQVSELQAELAKAQAEILKMQCQQTNLLTLLCMDVDNNTTTTNPTTSNTSPTTSSDQDHLSFLFSSSPTSPLQDGINSQLFESSLLNFYAENNCNLNSDPLWT